MMRSTVVALVSFAAALMLLSRRPAATSSTPLVDANTPPATLSLGPSDAPHRLVIYSDYQCPACALLHREAEPALRELAESGPLRLELRHFPLAGHRRASRAAVAAACAARQSAGWKMHDALFRTATRWTSQAPSAPWFRHLADSFELDRPEFDLCIKDTGVAGLLAADLALGRADWGAGAFPRRPPRDRPLATRARAPGEAADPRCRALTLRADTAAYGP